MPRDRGGDGSATRRFRGRSTHAHQLHDSLPGLPPARRGRVRRPSTAHAEFCRLFPALERRTRVCHSSTGVATSSLPDDELTEMMNWLLLTYSAEQLPQPFVPFSAEEVAALRSELEADPEKTRMRILRQIAEELPALANNLHGDRGT